MSPERHGMVCSSVCPLVDMTGPVHLPPCSQASQVDVSPVVAAAPSCCQPQLLDILPSLSAPNTHGQQLQVHSHQPIINKRKHMIWLWQARSNMMLSSRTQAWEKQQMCPSHKRLHCTAVLQQVSASQQCGRRQFTTPEPAPGLLPAPAPWPPALMKHQMPLLAVGSPLLWRSVHQL